MAIGLVFVFILLMNLALPVTSPTSTGGVFYSIAPINLGNYTFLLYPFSIAAVLVSGWLLIQADAEATSQLDIKFINNLISTKQLTTKGVQNDQVVQAGDTIPQEGNEQSGKGQELKGAQEAQQTNTL